MHRLGLITFAAALAVPSSALAADLPEHEPISILVVGDAVNPHALAAWEVTEPHDLEAALADPGSGLNVASVQAVDSSCVDAALTSLGDGTADVLVYFAHQSARSCGGQDRQGELTTAVETFLVEGGGVVVFHHGIFTDPGKGPLLQLLGGQADAIEWNTTAGQNVLAVAPEHFVAQNGVAYHDSITFAAQSWGVTQGDYPAFNNAPDERYPGLANLTEPGETRVVLFASDYGGGQVLGYDLHREPWTGHVVMYQPGEYQPHALDDLAGNNFQILANAVLYTATTVEEPVDPGETGDGGGTDGGSSDTGEDGGDTGTTSGDGGHDAGTADAATSGTGGNSTSGGTDGAPAADAAVRSRCQVSATPGASPWLTLLMVLGLRVRRRPRNR